MGRALVLAIVNGAPVAVSGVTECYRLAAALYDAPEVEIRTVARHDAYSARVYMHGMPVGRAVEGGTGAAALRGLRLALREESAGRAAQIAEALARDDGRTSDPWICTHAEIREWATATGERAQWCRACGAVRTIRDGEEDCAWFGPSRRR